MDSIDFDSASAPCRWQPAPLDRVDFAGERAAAVKSVPSQIGAAAAFFEIGATAAFAGRPVIALFVPVCRRPITATREIGAASVDRECGCGTDFAAASLPSAAALQLAILAPRTMTPALFPDMPRASGILPLDDGAAVLREFAEPDAVALFAALQEVVAAAPLRHLVTPGGKTMSVAMSNCGDVGWLSDRRGYRYDPVDPLSGQPWPVMPACFRDLAERAAAVAGFDGFAPDACLINCYRPAARLTLHRDEDERDFTAPIVSVSLGLPATFLWGGIRRGDRARRIPLVHGDVVVWGGPARLTYHGVQPLVDGCHPLTGRCRYNLTFRRAL